MPNLFVYNRKEGDEVFTDAFNLDYVIRLFGLEKGESVILLDDFHEDIREIPVPMKTNKAQAVRLEKRKVQVCSEIHLDAEDTSRFLDIFKTGKPKKNIETDIHIGESV